MTIGVIIEEIFLRISGGKPNPDGAVMRSDIRMLLPAAINYAMDKAYNINLQTEGDRDYPSEFYTVFENVTIDRTSRIPTISLMAGTVPLKGGAGIRFVYDDCGNQYAPLSDADMGSVEYYSSLTPGMGWYKRTGIKLALYGTNPLAEKLNYQAITRVEELDDDDEAPLQAGTENDVLTLLINWFANKLPSNTLINTRDTNAADA